LALFRRRVQASHHAEQIACSFERELIRTARHAHRVAEGGPGCSELLEKGPNDVGGEARDGVTAVVSAPHDGIAGITTVVRDAPSGHEGVLRRGALVTRDEGVASSFSVRDPYHLVGCAVYLPNGERARAAAFRSFFRQPTGDRCDAAKHAAELAADPDR